jgi:hypothetical protein
MDSREREARERASDAISPERLIDALDRNDPAELDRIRTELAWTEDGALLDLEKHAENAAVQRGDGERMLDRLRNVVQSILLHRLLRRRKSV